MKWKYCFLSSVQNDELKEVYFNMTSARKKHIDSKKVTEDRLRSLLGEKLIKELLKEEFGINEPVIEMKENGCPYVVGENIHISITHSGDLVACAADIKPIGIDAEKIRPINLKIINRVCLEGEKQYILSETLKSLERFLEVFTAKEAYFKRQATGITDFKSVDTLTLNKAIFNINGYIIQIVN